MRTTLDERLTIWRLRNKHDIGPKAISNLFPEINYSTIRRLCATWTPTQDQIHATPEPLPTKEQVTIDHKEDAIIFAAKTNDISRIKTLEELIETANIDLNQWTIDRWIANAWENAMKSVEGLPVITTLFQVKAYLKPNPLAPIKALIEAMRDEIREGAPAYLSPPSYTLNNESKNMLEISIPDMHFGMLALKEETDEEWNLDIAEAVYRTAINELLEKASKDNPIDQIVFPIGSDLLHINNASKTTLAGTNMDSVHSVKMLFKRVKNILRDAITDLAEVAPVHVMSVPGNHDHTVSYFLTQALEDCFYHHPSVTFDNSAKGRKYYKWGEALIGFTHGDQEKHANLPGLMANEKPLEWAITQWHEWHIGHKHQKKADHFLPTVTHSGVIVRTLPSLVAADAWHYKKGFVGGVRCAEAYLWNESNAHVATYNANLLKIKDGIDCTIAV